MPKKVKKRIKQYKSAIIRIMQELRIDATCLSVMAQGKSPNLDGTIELSSNVNEYNFPYPVIQLSADTAKYIDNLELDFSEIV